MAGPQWPLRLSFVVFLAGMVLALRLPPLGVLWFAFPE